MRIIKHKWFFLWEFEEEEKWLNEMSAKGLQLVGVGYCKYIFEEATPGEYNYQLELLKQSPASSESIKYIRFMEEMGVEHIGNMLRWAYFRRKATEGEFEIYSDLESKISYLKRIVGFMFIFVPFLLWAAIVNGLNYINGSNSLSLYVSILDLLVLSMNSHGLYRLNSKIQRLRHEKLIRE
jgi:hypothetical protein